MTTARVVAALRELADALEQGDAVPVPAKSAPRLRKAAVRLPPMPQEPPSELDRARARKALIRAGYVETK